MSSLSLSLWGSIDFLGDKIYLAQIDDVVCYLLLNLQSTEFRSTVVVFSQVMGTSFNQK